MSEPRFDYGDKVTLVKELLGRHYISQNAIIGMRGIVVGHGCGNWEQTIYWLESDYAGEPFGVSTWQTTYVMNDDIKSGWGT